LLNNNPASKKDLTALGKRLRFDGEPFKIFQVSTEFVSCLASFATGRSPRRVLR